MKTWATCSLLSLAALLAGCGGDKADSTASSDAVAVITTSSPTSGPVSAPTPTPTPTPTPVASSLALATTTDFTSQAAALYSVKPSIAGCQPGKLSSATTATMLKTLNVIRALHKLPPVVYSSTDEAAAQTAALLQAANDSLSHTPPTTWKCYTALGAAGSGSSNLYAGFGSGLTLLTDDQVLAGWLTEANNITANNIGHRRWLLDPFLGSVAYGRVAVASPTKTRADAAALKVFNNTGSGVASGTLPAYVAYPYQDYPAKYFNTASLLSFGVVANTSSTWGANAQVNFSRAVVTVRQRGGSTLAVSKQSSDNQGYGLPNNLQFAVAGLRAGVYYDVTITGVVVNGASKSYSYYFRIV